MADTVTKGITITFRGDTVEFDNSVASMNRAMRLLQNETAKLNRELKLDPTNVDLLNQKLDLLRQRETLITDEMKRYRASLVDAIKPTTQLTSTTEWQKYNTEIQTATTKMNTLSTLMGNLVDANGNITDPVLWRQMREEYNKTYDTWVEMRIALVDLAEQNNASFDGNVVTDYVTRMNNLEKELANVGSQIDNTVAELDKIGGTKHIINLEKLGTALKTVGNEFETISNVTRQISDRAQKGLANMVNSASAFETAMAGVAKVLDEGDLENAGLTIGDIAQGIRNMAKEIPATTTEIASIAEMAGQLGISANRIMDFTRVIADLGVTTNIAGNEGAQVLAQFLNIVGDKEAQHIENLASAIVALGNNSATTENDILQMSKMLASAGTAIGLTQQEILGLSTAMSSAGISASVGGNNLSKVLNEIDKAVGSGKYKEISPWAKQAGMSIQEFNNKWKNTPIDVIKSLFKEMAEGNAKGKAFGEMLDKLGIDDMRTSDVMRRLSLSVENLDTYISMSNTEWEKNSALTIEAEKRYQTFDSKLKTFSNSLTDLYITLGDKILPILTPVIDKTKELFEKIGSADDKTQKYIIALTAFVAILSPVSKWLGNISGGLGTFFTALGMAKSGTADETVALGGLAQKLQNILNNGLVTTLKTQFSNLGKGLFEAIKRVTGFSESTSSLWGVITGNPLALLAIAVGAVITALITAYTTSEDFRKKVNELWAKIKNDLTPVMNGLVNAVKSLWSWLKEKLTPLLNPLLDIAFDFLQLISDIWDIIVQAINAIWPIITDFWNNVLKPLAEWLSAVFVDTLKTIFTWIDGAIKLFGTLIGKANEYTGAVNKASKTTGYVDGIFKKPNGINQLRVDALHAFASGGLGINTSGLGTVYNGGTLQLTTNINVNNNGTPISETEIRKWGNTITEIVSDNLGRSFAV